MNITAKRKVDGEEVVASAEYDFGENLDEMKEKFGAEVTFTSARRTMVIGIQALMRRLIDAGKTPDEIQQRVALHVPGVVSERVVDPVASLMSSWGTMSDEKKAEILKKLKTLR